jgi:hypothetical protein
LAAIDSIIFDQNSRSNFSFETFSMRALTIFSFWLLAKLSGDFARKHNRSFVFGAVVGLSIAITFTFVAAFLIVSF